MNRRLPARPPRQAQPQAECQIWFGWQQAITHLSLAELAPLVEDASSRGWINDTILEPRNFREDLSQAKQAADPIAAFSP